jgi:hypothetical protein
MELGARFGMRARLCQRPTALRQGCKGPGLTSPLSSSSQPRGNAGKEVNVPMSVRRRWRIAWVRRSLGSPVRRALVLPRARLAE